MRLALLVGYRSGILYPEDLDAVEVVYLDQDLSTFSSCASGIVGVQYFIGPVVVRHHLTRAGSQWVAIGVGRQVHSFPLLRSFDVLG